MNKTISPVKISIVLLLILLVISALTFFAVFKHQNNYKNKNEVKITTTFFPVNYIVEKIQGPYTAFTNLKFRVEGIIPLNVEPHDFEIGAKDIQKIYESDLFVYSGLGIEDKWVDKLNQNKNNSKVKFINLSTFISPFRVAGGEIDPHIWQDTENMEKMTRALGDEVLKLDMENKNILENNIKNGVAEFSDLGNETKGLLENCKIKTLITSHESFGYFARQYGFENISTAGFSPDSEVGLGEISSIKNKIKNDKIPVIFTEPGGENKVINNLAQEFKIKTENLSSLESLTDEQMKEGKNYKDLYRANVDNIVKSLKCSEKLAEK